DLHKWALINRALDFGQPEPVETYSTSPHLYADLDIPEGTKGRITTAPKKEDKPKREAGQRTRRRRPANAEGTQTDEGQGTHDGTGKEHHDGKPAPARRRRRRRSSGQGAQGA
ncbi:MAG TPA: ATP-dependent helicase, partial [Microbacterium sp.]|nr:ATP-dependent helicase [Microbacterium sp.]